MVPHEEDVTAVLLTNAQPNEVEKVGRDAEH